MKAKAIGLYVHFPFCVRKCNYCDFCSFDNLTESDRLRYIDALCEEIEGYAERNITLDTIFFGGGTPSLMDVDSIRRVFSSIRRSFTIADDTEITVEANPKTLNTRKLSAYRDLGVNRISMGLQSIHENELKILGRIHNYPEFLETYKMVRECGIDNVNIDLMYGIPEQTKDSFSDTIRTVIALRPEHVSLYGLILEEGTPLFDRRDSLRFPSEDDECDMYLAALESLKECGYEHYEISNYAISGRRSRHNMKYWNTEEYIGVGLAAYSYLDGKRYSNTADFTEYVSGVTTSLETVESVEVTDMAYEYVMLGLRLSDGISLSEYRERFGEDFYAARRAYIDELIKLGYATLSGDRLALTDRGMYVSNTILNELI